MKPVYEPDREPTYRAECDLCDWWETGGSAREIRRIGRAHMIDENLRSGHDNAVVTVWKVLGNLVNEYETGDRR